MGTDLYQWAVHGVVCRGKGFETTAITAIEDAASRHLAIREEVFELQCSGDSMPLPSSRHNCVGAVRACSVQGPW
jgi:hypothetical protein